MIKYIAILSLSIGVFACSESQKQKSTVADQETSLQFIQDPDVLEDVDKPIQSFVLGANETATKAFEFEKRNAAELLGMVPEFAHAVIVVEDHTVILIRKDGDCKESLAWETCMPRGTGYIKRSGELVEQDDYLNNIIGLPDDQERMIYFFE